MIDLGVDGFRVDAAKHIDETDMAAIGAGLNNTTSGSAPYITQEIYPGTPPAQDGVPYGTGDVLDFHLRRADEVPVPGRHRQPVELRRQLGPDGRGELQHVGHQPRHRAQRLLAQLQGRRHRGPRQRLPAGPGYGRPSVYSGWTSSQSDEAPPNSAGFVTDTNCASGWYCLDRNTAVSGMIGWHNAASGYAVANWQSPSSNVIGFGRGGAGFVALNNSSGASTYTYTTGLADGTYPNVIDGGATTVTVTGGKASLTVPAKSAVAFYDPNYICTVNCGGGSGGGGGGSTSVTATFDAYASTTTGTDVYVVGSSPRSAAGAWRTR